jgi:hypothetical protein
VTSGELETMKETAPNGLLQILEKDILETQA